MQTAVAVLVSGVVALFGVTSAVLGFIAEAKRLKVKLVWLICRVAAVIAVVYFWVGAALNAPMTRRAKIAGPDKEECYLLKGGIFVRAAVLSLITTSLGIMSCVLLRLPAATTDVTVEGQRAVGLPEWQAPNPKFARSSSSLGSGAWASAVQV
ncbi:unnamed protein product [Miscanthus lutarioriparius]|uniref:Uncharacterized protein n=1 Tax=Miscanthus lutarioriparius TaxID=422564 RepID=A0A811RX41_9POAL|nr:unnamed protein product [Miscanthus lutarioriparius]